MPDQNAPSLAHSDSHAGNRHGLHAMISEGALQGWSRFAREHGVTRTAVVEAIGQMMAADEGRGEPPPPDVIERVIWRAREVDSARRVRGKNR